MPQSTCTHDGCEKPERCKGLCDSHYRKQRYQERNPRTARACQGCGDIFVPEKSNAQTFCSKACTARHYVLTRPDRCSVDGCDRGRLAHGMCGLHYMRAHRPPRRVKQVACAACGTGIEKMEPSGKRQPVCSTRCRYFVTFGRWPEDGKEVVGPVPRLPRYPAASRAYAMPASKRVFVAGACEWCGETFLRAFPRGGSLSASCSKDCSIKAARVRSHQKRGRFVIPARRRQALYERDGWECQLCHEPVDQSLPASDIWAATLDHIVPQSRMLIPDHSDANLRLAHRWCNSVRGDETYYSADMLTA